MFARKSWSAIAVAAVIIAIAAITMNAYLGIGSDKRVETATDQATSQTVSGKIISTTVMDEAGGSLTYAGRIGEAPLATATATPEPAILDTFTGQPNITFTGSTPRT